MVTRGKEMVLSSSGSEAGRYGCSGVGAREARDVAARAAARSRRGAG
jgi:hypothetical protein